MVDVTGSGMGWDGGHSGNDIVKNFRILLEEVNG